MPSNDTGRKDLTGESQFTDPVHLRGTFDCSILFSSAANATVTIQRRFSADDPWMDVESYNSSIERTGETSYQGMEYRAGIKAGNHTAGTVSVRLRD